MPLSAEQRTILESIGAIPVTNPSGRQRPINIPPSGVFPLKVRKMLKSKFRVKPFKPTLKTIQE